jgi:hypothetical protein
MKTTNTLLIATALLSLNGTTHAALYDRGNGMIYDSALNVTWMQDANYAGTSGYSTKRDLNNTHAPGAMNWMEAQTWVGDLTYGGYTDWRLPSGHLLTGTHEWSYDGSTDAGYRNTRSELGHLYYELGNIEAYTNDHQYEPQPGYGFKNFLFTDAGTGLGVSFLNVQNYVYMELEDFPSTNEQYPEGAMWTFTGSGAHMAFYKRDYFYAWAVRDGDVAAVPVPAAAWLFGSGLIGLAAARRRK